jgi:hypothetical protein
VTEVSLLEPEPEGIGGYFVGHVPALAQSSIAAGGLDHLLRSAAPAIIWTPYFRLSVRVRNTLTR